MRSLGGYTSNNCNVSQNTIFDYIVFKTTYYIWINEELCITMRTLIFKAKKKEKKRHTVPIDIHK